MATQLYTTKNVVSLFRNCFTSVGITIAYGPSLFHTCAFNEMFGFLAVLFVGEKIAFLLCVAIPLRWSYPFKT